MSTMNIDGKTEEFSGTIEKFMLESGRNPDSYIYLVDGVPTPMDADLPENTVVKAVRVASGG